MYTRITDREAIQQTGKRQSALAPDRTMLHEAGFNFRIAYKGSYRKELRGLSPRPSGLRLSTKLVPTFADRECRVVSATDPYGRILDFLDRSHYFFFQIAP
jgi:hypothetical protein